MSEKDNPTTPPETTTPTTPTGSTAKWLDTIQPLVKWLKKSPEDVTAAILNAKLVDAADDDSAEVITDPELLEIDDFKKAFPDAASGSLKKALKAMQLAKPEEKAPSASHPSHVVPQVNPLEILAPVPNAGKSMLDGLSLVTIGKIERQVVANGIQVALANRAGLFEVPKTLLEMMEEYITHRMEEPAGQVYFDLEDEIAKQDNAEVLRLLKVSGRFTSKERKSDFLRRIDALWAPVREFHAQLQRWYDAYRTTVGDPSMLMTAMASMMSGVPQVGPSMVTMPDTAALHDGAQLVIRAVNTAYAGRAIPAAMALAYDAERINGFLVNPEVVRYTGCTNREELARTLGHKLGNVLVTPDYRRLEQSLVQFILNVYELDQHAPQGSPQEPRFIGALFQVGQSIPWEKLFVNETPVNGNGRRRTRDEQPYPIGGSRRDANDPFNGK